MVVLRVVPAREDGQEETAGPSADTIRAIADIACALMPEVRAIAATRVEREQVTEVAREDACTLAVAWLRQLSWLVRQRSASATPAVSGLALPRDCRLLCDDAWFLAISAAEARTILDGIPQMPDAGDIFGRANSIFGL